METAYTAEFADGTYRFWLPLPRVIAAEREMGRDGAPRSVLALFYDLGESLGSALGEMVLAGSMDARISECQTVIRNALIGGNEALIDGETSVVGESQARELVATYCYPARPMMHDIGLAWQILHAAVYGINTSGSKKKDAGSGDPGPS